MAYEAPDHEALAFDLGTTYAAPAPDALAFELGVLGHLARAIGDLTSGSWHPSTGATLWGCIDEPEADDDDYIYTHALDECQLDLNDTAWPGSALQTVSYRADSTSGNSITVALKQGTTTIASWSHALTSSPALYTQTLSGGQIAAITSGSGFSLAFTAT